jgi:hypothetical protein
VGEKSSAPVEGSSSSNRFLGLGFGVMACLSFMSRGLGESHGHLRVACSVVLYFFG